jgi:hypothetical protein
MQPLRWEANVLFIHPQHVPSTERAASGVARNSAGERMHLAAPSPSSHCEGEEGGWGKVRATRRMPQHGLVHRFRPLPHRLEQV